jgi:type IV pilus biogenesis protein CpaD/CtpE
MRLFHIATFAGLILALAACSNAEPLNPDFGASVRHNMMIHIINPAPAHANRGAPDMRGQRAADVIERYNKGAATPLVIEKTGDK